MRLGFPGWGQSAPVRHGHTPTWAKLRDLVDETCAAPTIAQARGAVAAWLERNVGTSTPFIARLEEGPTAVYANQIDAPIVERLFADPMRYADEVERITQQVFVERGAVAYVLEDIARESTLTEEVLLPTGVTVGVMTACAVGKRPVLRAFFGHDRVFEEERAIIAAAVRILAMSELAHEPPPIAAPLLDAPRPKRKEDLTTREREVLEYVALGYTNAEIALACGNATNTVKHQLASIFRKLGASTRAEAVRIALLEGYVARLART